MINYCADERVNEAVNKAWKRLCFESGRFETEQEADNWAGDVAWDFLSDVLDNLGIDCGSED